jgi:Ca2+/Na+ antiporter
MIGKNLEVGIMKNTKAKSTAYSNFNYVNFEANLWFRFATALTVAVVLAVNYFDEINKWVVVAFLVFYPVIVICSGFYYKCKANELYEKQQSESNNLPDNSKSSIKTNNDK